MDDINSKKYDMSYIDDIITIGGNLKNKNKNKYLKFINENRKLKEHFLKESEKIVLYINDNKLENKHIQKGGNPLLFITLSAAAIAGLAYIMYKHNHRKHCHPEYPLIDVDTTPTPEDLLLKILPKSFISEYSGSDDILTNIYDKLKKIYIPFSFLNEDTVGKKILVETGKILSSIGADIVTFGEGGDVIISLLFTIKNIIEVLMQVVKSLSELLDDADALRFIYDILNINFTEGPVGVKCWIKYILDEYGSDSESYDLICSFFDSILDKLAAFIGNTVGTMIPDSAGLPGLLIPIIVAKARSGALKYVEKKVDHYYNKIPRRYHILIRNPKAFKKFLDKKILKKITQKIILKIAGKKRGTLIIKTIYRNTGLIALGIHKGFALIYSLTRILIECEK